MQLPLFFEPDLHTSQTIIALNSVSAHHCVQVLRMQKNEQLMLANGKGLTAKAIIVEANKRNCTVSILGFNHHEKPLKQVCVAVSLLKNAARFEWFLEKATEIGVTQIVPLLCKRTEKQHFRYDRMHQILVSAMLQSQQTWLPTLAEPTLFANHVQAALPKDAKRFIAHCEEVGDKKYIQTDQTDTYVEILIGPEGDFSPEEITLALTNNYQPVSLGNTRLRTETAALVAATLLVHQ